MAERDRLKELYAAIEKRAPVAEVSSLIVNECMLSARKWVNRYWGLEDYGSALHCATYNNHVDLVRELISRYAVDVNQPTTKGGNSALHAASFYGRTAVAQLLIANGAKVNATNSRGRSALHDASDKGRTEVVRLLVEQGANVNATDSDGNTPLHASAKSDRGNDYSHVNIMDVLLKAGANPSTENKDGKPPANIARTNARERLLQVAAADYNLTHVIRMKPKVVRLAVLGDEAVGKTQFIETVTSSTIAAYLHSLLSPPAKGTDAYIAQRTPGVKLVDITLPDGRVVRAMDMGGQPQFIASHRPIVVTSFGMYLLVLNLLIGKEDMLKSGRYWIQFVLATRDPAMFQDCPPPPLFVLFSHLDELSGVNPQQLAGDVYALLHDEFGVYFNWFVGNPFVANCRRPSSELSRLVAGLAEGHQQVSKAMPLEPKINDAIRRALKARSQSSQPASAILKLDDYYRFVREHVPHVADKDLPSLTTLLDVQADVMRFECDQVEPGETSSYIVVDPHNVCHNVLKAILSPRHFKGNHLVFPPHGVIEGPKLDKALSDAGVDPKVGKGLLHFAKISTPNPQPPGSDFFPIHVEATTGTWEDDSRTVPQSGMLVHSTKIPLSQAFIPALQVELSKKTGGIHKKSLIWKTGLVVSWEEKVTIMVQQAEDGCDVNILARAVPNQPHDCAVALASVSKITVKTAEDVSPGTETELLYLSPSQISKGDKPTVTYTGREVIQHCKERRTLRYQHVTDDADEIMPVVQAAQPHLCEIEGLSVGGTSREHHPSGAEGHVNFGFGQSESSSSGTGCRTVGQLVDWSVGQSAGQSAGQSDRVELTSGSAVLDEIAQYFSEAFVYSLAAILLENRCPGGGLGFIRQHSSAFAQPNWSLMAHLVLAEWCDKSDRVFGHDLMPVLEKVLPTAAKAFRTKLLGTAA